MFCAKYRINFYYMKSEKRVDKDDESRLKKIDDGSVINTWA